MKRVMFIALGAMFLAAGVYARKYNPNFDNGVSLSEFQKAAQEMDSPRLYVPLSRIDGSIIKRLNSGEERLIGTTEKLPAPGQGYYFGPTADWVRKSQVFENGKIYASTLHGHEDPTAYKLLGEWDAITTEDVQMLTVADIFDPKDHQLYLDGTASNENYKKLKARIDKYNKDLAAYKQNCKDGPETSPDCAMEHERLGKEHDALLVAMNQHNDNVAKLKQRYATLQGEASSFYKKVQDWEIRIAYFITAVKDYLSGAAMCTLTGTETEPVSVGDPPQIAFLTRCIYLCSNNKEWSFIWISSVTYYECPKIVADGENPPMPGRHIDFGKTDPMFSDLLRSSQ